MKKSLKKVCFLCTALLAISMNHNINLVNAETSDYSYTFTSKVFTALKETKDLGGHSWTVTGTSKSGNFSYDATNGQNFGSTSSKYFSPLHLESVSEFSNVASISIQTKAKTGTKLDVYVGGEAVTQFSLSATLSTYTYTLPSLPSGVVKFSYTMGSSKGAICIKSFTISMDNCSGGEVETPTYDEVVVGNSLNLTGSNLDGLTSKSSDVIATNEDVSYQVTKLDNTNGDIWFSKASDNSGLYNLNPYSKSIKRLLVQDSTYAGTYDVYGVSSMDDLTNSNNKASKSSVKMLNDGEFINVTQYSFDGLDVRHFNMVTTKSSTSNVKNIWIEFVDRYSISFDSNDGVSAVQSYTLLANESMKAPSVTREGYKFLGWESSDNSIAADESVSVSKDTVYVAKWEKELSNTKASIEFSYTKHYGEEASLAASIPTSSSTTTMNDTKNYGASFGLGDVVEVTSKQNNAYSHTAYYSSKIQLKYAKSAGTHGSGLKLTAANGYAISAVSLSVQNDSFDSIDVLDSNGDVVSSSESVVLSTPAASIELANKTTSTVYITGLTVTYVTVTYDNVRSMSIGAFADYTKIQMDDYVNFTACGFVVSKESGTKDLSQGMSLESFNALNSSEYKTVNVDSSYWNTNDGLSFSMKINNVPESVWNVEFTFVSYIVCDGQVYFANSKSCSVLSLAQQYLDKDVEDDSLINNEQEDALRALLNR